MTQPVPPEYLRRRPKPGILGPRPAVAGEASRPSSRPSPRRPAAHHDPPSAAALEPIKAPGLGAFLRRHPNLGRRSALGAIVGGAVLFVIACITTPLASANGAASRPASTPTQADLPFTRMATVASGEARAPAVEQAVKRNPRHVPKPAPATHGVISGPAANGIPKVALNAYRVAAARMANVEPGCGIDWALLAGIGREESDHGRFAGAVLQADGVSTPRIVGIPLNGSGTALISDTDGGALDGDTVYDHAVGPMQFIPSTWGIYGTDADGDGKANVFDINDAALAAGRYLCAAGGNLRTHDGQVRAVLAYNHSDEYLAQVLALADAYRRGVPISGLPVGITSGPLPKVTDTGYIPPANPGTPPAAERHRAHSPAGSAGHRAGHHAKRGTSTPTAPKPGPSGSGGSRHTGSSAPAPGKSTPTPTPTKSGSPTKTPAPSSPTPTPTPTKTCTPLQHLLGQC